MSLARIRFNKRSVIVTWLISYISVLLVPIMISGFLYTATWHVVESEVNRANESTLQQMEQAIDNSLAGIERLSLEIALSKRVAGFINVVSPLTDNDYYDLVSIANELRVYKTANDFIEQIYIYYKNSDTVLSTRDHTDSRTLFQSIGEKDGVSYEAWKKFFDKRYIQEYAPVSIRDDNNNSVKAVMYAKSVILDNLDYPGAVILFIIKDSKLLENIPSTHKPSIAVLDKENRLIASTGIEPSLGFLEYDKLSGKNGLFYDKVAGKKVAVSYTTSVNTEWKYVSMIPAELFDDKMKYMKKLIYFSILLCLVIGGLVAFLFLRKNYLPINLLIRSFSVKSGITFDSDSNEYGFLQDALNNTFAEKEKIDLRLYQHRDAIRSHFLQGLLKGRLEQNVPVHESLAAHDIRLSSDYFAVLLLHIDFFGKFDVEDSTDPQKVKLLHFILMNVAEEVTGDHNKAFTTEMDYMHACIINFGTEPDKEGLEQIALGVRSFLLEHFHVRLTVAISAIHQGMHGISRAYQETLTAFEYRLVMGSGEVIKYEELPSSETTQSFRSYYYPVHVENHLINFVKAGDYEKSSGLIDEIIEINISDASLSVPLAKCLMFDLISTLLKTMDEIGTSTNKREFIERMNPIDRLTGCKTIQEMNVQIRDVLNQVCRFIQEDNGQEHNQLSQQVIEYVKNNYNEENLNISMVGEKFGLTPSYLSKQFKTQSGEALLDFINRIRLEEAKKWLTQPNQSIAEIAKKVGYTDINTFNRIFKKSEGITPSKYREIQ